MNERRFVEPTAAKSHISVVKPKTLLLLLLLLIGGAVAAWLVIERKGGSGGEQPYKTNDTDVEAANRAIASANSNAQAPDSGATSRANTKPDGKIVTLQLKVVTSAGAPVNAPWVSNTSDPAPSISVEANKVTVTGSLPFHLQISSEDCAGVRKVDITDAPSGEQTVVLLTKIHIHLTVRGEKDASLEDERGAFVYNTGSGPQSIADIQFPAAADVHISVPAGNCEIGWASEKWSTGLKTVTLTDGANIQLTAAPRATGTVRVRSAAEPSLQFSLDPSAGLRTYPRDLLLGTATARPDGDRWIFENIPAGPARLYLSPGADAEPILKNIEITAGKVIEAGT